MRPHGRFDAVVAWLTVAACGGESAPTATAELCGVQLLVTTDWVLHDEGNFTLRTPRSYGEARRGGFDSYGGSWTSGSKSVSYDWGAHSNALDDPGEVGATEADYCDAAPVGVVRLLLAADGDRPAGRVVAAHWDGLEAEDIPQEESLTVVGMSRDQTDAAELLTILSTIQIREPAQRTAWPGDLGVYVCDSLSQSANCN